MTAFVLIEIFDDDPWHLCGGRLHPESGASLSAESFSMRSGVSLALSHQRMAVKRRGQATLVKAVSRRAGRAQREP
jgi:hypothetical protein